MSIRPQHDTYRHVAVFFVTFLGGFWSLFRINRRMALVFLIVIGHRLLVTLLFYGYARHGILLWPFWAICSGAMISGIYTKFNKRYWITGVFIVCLSCLIAVDIWSATHPPRIQVDYQTNPSSGRPDQQQIMTFRVGRVAEEGKRRIGE